MRLAFTITEVMVPAVAIVLVLVVFGWFYRYSRSRIWLESETKAALWRMLVAIGPMFGARVDPPPPEPPAVITPGPEPPEPYVVVSPRDMPGQHEDGE